MILCPLTCANVAYICQRCRHLHTSCTLWLTRQGRSAARCGPFPRPCRATLIEVPAPRDRASLPGALWRGAALHAEILGRAAGRNGFGVSMAEPGPRPVTFRAMFSEELRARRQQAGLLQREFAEKAHVSLSSVKQYEG